MRELENLVERAVIKSKEGRLDMDTPKGHDTALDRRKSLREHEHGHIVDALRDCNWIVEGSREAAE